MRERGVGREGLRRVEDRGLPERPRVTIVTPSYQQAEFLDTTIASVLAQDYPNIEYIVVDGGSTDGSVDIIRSHAAGIARWVSESDGGQAEAINKGFAMATGDILAWINSDDYYFPWAVSTAVRRFLESPDLAVFYGDAVAVDRTGCFEEYCWWVEPFDKNRLLSMLDFIVQPTTFFRRDRLREVGPLDPDLRFALDWDLWCRFARRDLAFHYEMRPIAVQRHHAATKTRTGGLARLREIRRVQQRHAGGGWPHASLFYLADYAQHARSLPAFAREASAMLLRALGWRNYLQMLRTARLQYGIHQYSRRLCARRVVLHLPLFEPADRIELGYRVPWAATRRRQALSVRVNDREVGFFRCADHPDRQVLSLPLEEACHAAKHVTLDLEFSESRRVRSVRNLFRPLEVSAIVEGVRLV